jgi:uncharacterized membrane protein
MSGGKTWWKWPLGLALLFETLFGAYDHRNLLVAGEFGALVSEQYVWIGALAGVAIIGLAGVRQRPSRIGWRDLPLLALAIPPIVWWVLDRGMVHIGGYDQSVLANFGWVLLQGRRPHVDFPCTLTPHFYLGSKYAYLWFGVAWRSNVILSAIYAGVSFAWSYLLLRSMDLPKTSAAVIALLGQSLCLMLSCYFWYNAVGTNDAILLFLSARAWVDRPRSKLLFASLATAFAIVLLDKPNGWVLPVCLAVGFLGSREHRVRFAGCMLATLGLILVAAYFGPFDIMATLRMYPRLAKARPPGLEMVFHSLNFSRWHGPIETGKACIFVATFVAAAFVYVRARRSAGQTSDGRGWASAWTYAGALAIGAAFFFTNGEPKCTDLAVPTVAFAVWVAKREPWRIEDGVYSPRRIALICAVWLCLFCLCQGLFDGWIRYRVYYICPEAFWQRKISDEPVATAYMSGVRGSPKLVQVMDDLVRTVNKYPDGEIFFGPWLEFAYPAFGRPSPDRFPVWWHPGISYFPDDADFAVEAFSNRQFDTLIFLKDVYYQMPPAILDGLEEWYVVDEVCPTVTVYRRKGKAIQP